MGRENQQERHVEDLNWLAGAWESDGWFSLRQQKKKTGRSITPQCGITNTDSLYIKEVKSILEEVGLSYYQRSGYISDIGKKEKTEILIQGMKRVHRFLNVLHPYFRSSKKERAGILLSFINYRLSGPQNKKYGDVEDKMFSDMRLMNGYRLRESSETLRQGSVII